MDGVPCRIESKQTRLRKAGPDFALSEVVCRVHRKHFTLYPPGWVPYARSAVAPAPGGRPSPTVSAVTEVVPVAGDQADVESAWATTAFAVAVKRGPIRGERRTASRRLALAAAVLGLSTEPALGQTVAGVLAVDLAVHLEQRTAYGRATRFAERAAAVRATLCALPRGPDLWLRVLCAGYRAGVWGQVRQVAAQRGLVPLFP